MNIYIHKYNLTESRQFKSLKISQNWMIKKDPDLSDEKCFSSNKVWMSSTFEMTPYKADGFTNIFFSTYKIQIILSEHEIFNYISSTRPTIHLEKRDFWKCIYRQGAWVRWGNVHQLYSVTMCCFIMWCFIIVESFWLEKKHL